MVFSGSTATLFAGTFGKPVPTATQLVPPVVERSLRHAGPSAMAAMSALALAHHQTSGVGAATLAAVVAVGFSMVLVNREVPLALVVAGGLGLYQIVLFGSRVIGGL